MTAAARAARLARSWRSVPTAALVGPVDARPVRAAGWEVRGRLARDPFAGGEGPVPGAQDVAGYLDVAELLADERVDCAVVDGSDPELVALLPALRRAGLLVLLPTAAPLDPEPLRAAHAVDGPATGVGLVRRWQPWAATVRAALPLAGGPPLQVTVRGWPRGAAEAAELVDLVAQWCGEVAAVVAAPGPLPAARLPAGEPVSWALLTASGATVLVSHEGAGPSARLSFATARLDAAPTRVRWEGGEQLPLVPLPAWVPPAPAGTPPGLVATAAALSEALGDGDPAPHAGGRHGPVPAGLGDLLVAAQVLTALRDSARREALLPVA